MVLWLLGMPGRFLKRLCTLGQNLRTWFNKAEWRSCRWRLRVGLIVAAVVVAVFGVLSALPWWVGASLVAVCVLAQSKSAVSITGRVVGATIAGIVTLAAVNYVVDKVFKLIGLRMPILLGLLFAIVVFALAARRYLQFAGWKGPSPADAAVLLAIGIIIGLPIIVALATHESTAKVPPPNATAPKVDVLIITDGGRGATVRAPAGEPTLSGFDVRYSVGVAIGAGVRWTKPAKDPQEALNALTSGDIAKSAQTPTVRPGVRAVALLDVDRTSPVASNPGLLPNVVGTKGEVSRWRRIASAAGSSGVGPTPVFALLQTAAHRRLASWERSMPKGHVLSRQAQTQTSVTAIGVTMGVATPSSDADYALALHYRPVLLFDSHEEVPRPLSVNWLFEKRLVSLCKDGGAKTDCTVVDASSKLTSGGTHLELSLPVREALQGLASRDASDAGVVGKEAILALPSLPQRAAGSAPTGAQELVGPITPGQLRGGADTAIYVHPVADERDGHQLLYLDYWWYLSDNPSGVGGGALCGAGMVIPGITCENHVSDWEGMTVVVDRTSAHPFIKSVHYAEHKDVVAYEWKQLLQFWEGRSARRTAARRAAAPVPGFARELAERDERPLAFIASGTHATYAQPCLRQCRQISADVGEGEHDGRLPWIGDFTATCGTGSCLQLLPTYEGGAHPALWNAFAGTWGKRECALTYYCDQTTPPPAPGQQGRYERPARCTRSVNSNWKPNHDQCDP
jgi:hypothetical protein